MKIVTYDSREDWLKGRLGKITGSKLNEVFSVKEATKDDISKILDQEKVEYKKSDKKEILEGLVPEKYKSELLGKREYKIGFYEVLAERLAVPEEGNETPIDRGSRLEGPALDVFAKITKKKIKNDLILWISDEDESMAYSPDGCISAKEVVEVKCLSSAKHLMAYFEQTIPSEYVKQCLQGFIVNEKLQICHVAFYDPRIPSLPLHWITLSRKDLASDIETYRQHELATVKEIEEKVNQLASY